MGDTRINRFRKSKKLSIVEFGAVLGISISYAEKLCYGSRIPSRSILAKIKRCFPETDLNFFCEQIAQNVR